MEKQVEIINAMGQEVKREVVSSQNLELSIDVSVLLQGIYFVRLFSTNNELLGNGKFVKE